MSARVVLLTLALVGCSSSEPVAPITSRPPQQFDSGVTRVCGVIPGSACEGEGEIARCLCGSFQEQIGRFVCCRGGVAVALDCQQARNARDCNGNLASMADAATSE